MTVCRVQPAAPRSTQKVACVGERNAARDPLAARYDRG